jgi:gluconolactonase
MRRALLGILAACGGNDPAPPADDAPPIEPDTPVVPFDPLVGIGTVELVDGGYQFTEGPQWREIEQDLVFSDIPANTIYRYVPGGPSPEIHRMPSGNSNGLAVDGNGALLAAEHGSRSVTRDGVEVVAEFEGSSLNSPNDLIVVGDTIYFTDPPFGIQPNQRELDFMGVFRLAGGTLTAEHRGALTERPNGIGISPDGAHIYVADSADGNLYRFPVLAGGALGPREMHADTSGGADGLAIDIAGNIFVTANDGVEVFAPDGSRWGVIEVPEKPANCAFGDADHKTLYITARTSLYKVRLANAGLPDR